MFRTLALSISTLLALSAAAQTSSLHESFKTMPASFTLMNLDGMSPFAADFGTSELAKPDMNWYVAGSKGILDARAEEGSRPGILSCSHRADAEKATNNWLITPLIAATDGTILSWEAKSIHFSLRESYSIMVSTTDMDPQSFTEVMHVDNEDYLWKKRSVDLSSFAGQNIYVAFVHNSLNKFLLALTDVDVCVPTKPDLTAVNTGRHYFDATEEGVVSFRLQNHGSSATLAALEVRAGDAVKGSLTAFPDDIFKGGEVSIPIELTLNEPYQYQLVAKFADGTEAVVLEDFANRSWFRRKMLIEKFTGTWCNSCPRVTYPYHYGMTKYGADEFIGVESHSPGTGGDTDGYAEYASPTVYSVNGDYPALWFNRAHEINSVKPQILAPIYEAEMMPTKAEITSISYVPDALGNITVTATYRFAEDIDNSANEIRPHFTLVEKECAPSKSTQLQTWQLPASNIWHAEFFYLPTKVAKELTVLHNVVRSSSGRLTGLEDGAFPAQIKAGEEYTVTGYLELTDKIADRSELRIVATAVDASVRTYEIMNAGALDVDLTEVKAVDSVITLNATEWKLEPGEMGLLAYTLEPENKSVKVTWSSSNPEVATIMASGILTAVAVGECDITATTSQGISATCHVIVGKQNSVSELNAETVKAVRKGSLLEVALPQTACKLTVHDVAGRTIASAIASGNATLEVPDSGLLLLTIESSSSSMTIKL